MRFNLNLWSRRNPLIIIFAVLAQAVPMLKAEDPEITNYKTGIDAIWSGTKGVDYMEEYFYSDKLVSDRKVVYIKSDTLITLSHNQRNVARVGAMRVYGQIGVNGLDGIPNSGDEGKIRYRIDADMSWGPQWTNQGADASANPAYTVPLSFASMKYRDGSTVLGRTGNNGQPVSAKSKHLNYGVLDSFGDQWHTLQVADDDWFSTTDTEWRASDGKILHFVVNPKTPALSVRATGNAQFYTTPPKTYFLPKIHEQITYFNARTGSVTFELRDINGNNVNYRINAGPWKAAPNPTLTPADFVDGKNTLEYYYTGNAAHTKTRIVVKNPEFPSSGETHGYVAIGNSDNYSATLARRGKSPFKYHWDRGVSGASDTGNRSAWDAVQGKGLRFVPTGAFHNALIAKTNGVAAVQSGRTKSYATYAKEMVLQNGRTIDPVGFELHQPQNTGPTRELFYRGYWDVSHTLDLAYAYDLLISIFRSDQNPNGITPVEDHFIRDSIAGNIVECLMFTNSLQGSYEPVGFNDGGMWDTARKVGAVVGMFAIPTYSTSYYGTSGLDGNTTVYPYTPYPQFPMTWKQVFLDEDQPMRGYPELAQRGIGIEEYLLAPGGDFKDRVAYAGLMGSVLTHVANVLKFHYPAKKLPNLEAFFLKCVSGTVMGLKDGSGPNRRIFLSSFNGRFPVVANVGIPLMKSLPSTDPDSDAQQINGNMPIGMIWYDVDYVSGTLGAPTNASVK